MSPEERTGTATFPRVFVRADTPDAGENEAIKEAALSAGFTGLITSSDAAAKNPGRFTVLTRTGDRLFSGDSPAGQIYHITSKESLDAVEDNGGIAVIETAGWRVLPLENLISRLQKTKIYAAVNSPEEAALAAEILEKGCAGVVISAGAGKIQDFVCDASAEKISLTPAVITKITPVPLSDRVCIDTTSILDSDEGMLVGSSAACLFFICSEHAKSEFTNPRPFRVNAGAIHSYIQLPGGITAYLSELSAGALLLSCKADGATRTVAAGRIKIERRPMLLISAEIRGAAGTAETAENTSGCPVCGSVIVQNAETIRLLTPNGPVSAAELSVGDTVLVKTGSGGRHFGTPVDETVREL
ncbi:MAG: 3-dehydroquinate synthase II [Methanocorpusculum sp.]|nr:3-dehydroquinate synthase II [Methanocorpusculum sp.]